MVLLKTGTGKDMEAFVGADERTGECTRSAICDTCVGVRFVGSFFCPTSDMSDGNGKSIRSPGKTS
jgi:hypothetical protein